MFCLQQGRQLQTCTSGLAGLSIQRPIRTFCSHQCITQRGDLASAVSTYVALGLGPADGNEYPAPCIDARAVEQLSWPGQFCIHWKQAEPG